MENLKDIQLGSLLATTPEALQRIADSEAVVRNLRDIFPHLYALFLRWPIDWLIKIQFSNEQKVGPVHPTKPDIWDISLVIYRQQ